MKPTWLNNKYGEFINGYDLQIQITNKCNLKCKGCKNLSNIGNDWEISLEDFEKSLKYLKQNFPSIQVFTLTGGEPFMHSKIIKLCKIFHKYYPNKILDIATNGSLLLNKKNDIKDIEKFTHFSISKYNLSDIKYLDIEKECQFNYDFTPDRNIFEIPIFDKKHSFTKFQYKTCKNFPMPSFILKNFNIYLCPISANLNELINIKKNIENKDFLNIKNSSEKDLNNFCLTEKIYCSYCNQNNNFLENTIPWNTYKDINEYFYTLKDYFLNDYYSYLKIIENYKKLLQNFIYNDALYKNENGVFYNFYNYLKQFNNLKYITFINNDEDFQCVLDILLNIKDKNYFLYIIFNNNISNENINRMYSILLDLSINFLAFKDYNLDLKLWIDFKDQNIKYIVNNAIEDNLHNFNLILIDNQNIKQYFNLKKYNIDNINFGNNLVKKINIIKKLINNQKPQLKELYNKLQSINLNDIQSVIIYYNPIQKISFNLKIKKIEYDIKSCVCNGDHQLIEELNFLFEEENKIKDIYCDVQNCIYYNNEFCNKYKKILKKDNNNFIPCQECSTIMKKGE